MSGHDPQANALYAAEREFYPKRPRSVDYAGHLIRGQVKSLGYEVQKLYGLPPVKFRWCPQRRSKFAAWVLYQHADTGEIESAAVVFSGVNPNSVYLVLHELAHVAVDFTWGAGNTEHHGREFAGVFSALLAHYYVLPADASAVIFRRRGVKRRPVQFCTPAALKKVRTRRLTAG